MPTQFYKIFLVLTILSLGLAWSAVPAASASQDPGIHLLQEDDQGLTLELVTPEFQIQEGLAESQPCQIIQVEGYGSTDTSGYPEIPLRGTLVGVPPNSTPTLTVVDSSPAAAVGQHNLCPVGQPILEGELEGQARYGGEKRQRDSEAYTKDVFSPEEMASLVMTGYLRSQRVAKVLFQPFQYNPVSGELRYYETIRVRVDFNSSKDAKQAWGKAESELTGEGGFETVLKDSLVNYGTARQWRTPPKPQSLALSPMNGSSVGLPSYKIVVNQDGIYQVTYEDLIAAGADFTGVNPHTFRLFRGGDYRLGLEITVDVQGEDDNTFDPGDRIIFYGQKVDTRYTDQNVYFLSWNGNNRKRMTVLDGTPGSGSVPDRFLTTLHLEQNMMYLSAYPSGVNNDVWYWNFLYAAPGPDSKPFTTTLNHLSTSLGLKARVRGLLKGYLVEGTMADPQHHVKIYLNGNPVDEIWWPSEQEYSFDVEVPQSDLKEGTNTILVERPTEAGITRDIVLINWFEIVYWHTYVAEGDSLNFTRGDDSAMPETNGVTESAVQFQVTDYTTSALEIFDITDPVNVARVDPFNVELESGKYKLSFEQQLSGEHRYLAQSLAKRLSPVDIVEDKLSYLHWDADGADYLLITHSDFYDAVVPLWNHRDDQMNAQIVRVEDVYDEFNGGVMDARAIKVFLAYAYDHWKPRPLYVLLVGDGNWDPRNYYGGGEPQYIPPYLEQVDPWLGETAAENRFVTISGGDDLPDMYIGRLAVKTSAQASAIVDKILAYEPTSPTDWQDWWRSFLFVADKYDPAAGDFTALSDEVANHYLPSPYEVQKVYYKITHNNLTDARTAIIQAINQGKLMVNYVGHGAIQQWGMDNLFNNSSIASLNNYGMLPFMTPMTCLEGSFHYPPFSPGTDSSSSLAEMLVREPGKGAIASFSPTGLGVASGHDFLDKGLYNAIFNLNITQIGAAVTQAKLYLYANSGGFHRDLIDTYALLGDPALKLPVLPILDAPSNLVATAVSQRQINLSWSDNTVDETEFRIERSPNGSTGWQPIDVVNANIKSYKNTGLTCGTPYYYRVRAYRAIDKLFSEYSNIATATTSRCYPIFFPLIVRLSP